MQRQNNYREVAGGAPLNVAVCPDCKSGMPYPKKTESLVWCKGCKGTFKADPVVRENCMTYEEYRRFKGEMEQEKQREQEKLRKLKDEKLNLQKEKLELQRNKIQEEKEQVAEKRMRRERIVDLWPMGPKELFEKLTAEGFEVSARTINRDVRHLRDTGRIK